MLARSRRFFPRSPGVVGSARLRIGMRYVQRAAPKTRRAQQGTSDGGSDPVHTVAWRPRDRSSPELQRLFPLGRYPFLRFLVLSVAPDLFSREQQTG
jgi:hypothetical protein